MKDKNGGKHGGRRVGAGRPKKEPTKVIRVPIKMADKFQALLSKEKALNDLIEKWESNLSCDSQNGYDRVKIAFQILEDLKAINNSLVEE